MARRPFWLSGAGADEPERERDRWQNRLRRLRRVNSLPRAVASARRLARTEMHLDAERLRRGLPTRRRSPRRDLRQIVIVTTAAPPWLTGTSVNPLCRAIALTKRGLSVTILFPWLEPANQAELFAPGGRFATRTEQEAWIRANFACDGVEILFYRAKYLPAIRSIVPTRSVESWVPPSDLLILEEPEHLLAPHPWQKLRDKSNTIVGIVHTHYLYIIALTLGRRAMHMAEPPLRAALPLVVRRNCALTICLSRTIEGYDGAVFENVNGVRDEFFAPAPIVSMQSETTAYFIGKLIWEKGFHEMCDLLAQTETRVLDVWGSGDDRAEILDYAQTQGVTLNLRGTSVHPNVDLRPYRVFVNPSTTEVLCTTTAEAIAMGKWVIIPRHVSNEFFYSFPNALVYENAAGFTAHLRRALSEPAPAGSRDALTWDAATERLLRLLQR